MRITIGGRSVAAQQTNAAIAKMIMTRVVREASTDTGKGVGLSGNRVDKLAQLMKAEAIHQAEALIPTIADVINSKGDGFTGDQLRGGVFLPGEFAGLGGGSVTWQPLTDKYHLWKTDRRFNRGLRHRQGRTVGQVRSSARNPEFFLLNRGLINYLSRNSTSIIRSRFGGVTLQVTHDGLLDNHVVETIYDARRVKILLGRIRLRVFPALSQSLMPGLASSRWTNVGRQTYFERSVFSRNMAYRMTNPQGVYRPLVLPIVQFFTLVRIPAAITNVINKQFGYRGLLQAPRDAS